MLRRKRVFIQPTKPMVKPQLKGNFRSVNVPHVHVSSPVHPKLAKPPSRTPRAGDSRFKVQKPSNAVRRFIKAHGKDAAIVLTAAGVTAGGVAIVKHTLDRREQRNNAIMTKLEGRKTTTNSVNPSIKTIQVQRATSTNAPTITDTNKPSAKMVSGQKRRK